MTRTTVATGIYRDAYGYEVRWQAHGRPKSKHFPADTPLETLKAYRQTKARIGARSAMPDGSFPRDAVRFLVGRKGLVSWKSDRAHLRPWIHRFRRLSRYAITREQIQKAITEWQRAGYKPKELRHRWRILRQCLDVYEVTPNPCQGVHLPIIQRTRPRSVPDTLVRDVALALRKQEIIGRLWDGKTRARFLVLATTGQRPTQVRRAQPADVDLERRIWFVEPAKGDNGAIVYLNDDMHAAWSLFIAANAWGRYDSRSFAKTLRRNGWPKGIRPYTLRHTVGLSMSELGIELGDISAHMGHANINTTRQAYVPALLSRLKDASERIDGRLGGPFATEPLPRTSTTSRRARKAKACQEAGHSSPNPVQEKGRLLDLKSTKTA